MDRNDLNTDFFNKFNDSCLNYYIDEALKNNHELKKAEKVVEQYRQEVKYSFGRELPSFSVSANYLGIKVPKLDNFQLKKNAFVLPFFANYEADLLLKNRDKTKSSKKQYEASQAQEKAIYLALLSDVATVYTNLLEYDELIKIAEENLAISTKLHKINQKRLERGVITTTQLNESMQNVESSKTVIENLKKQQEILLMQLAVLSGKSATEAQNLKRGTLQDFEYSGKIPNEIESDVIFSRPDVITAEKKLEKAKIDVRIARKEFLPTFNITGIWAFNTIASGSFFSWESSLAALLAGATQDIFAGGRKVVNLKMKKAKYEELFEEYKQTDLNAVKEVNTALCIIKHDTAVEKNTTNKTSLEYDNLMKSKQKLEQGTISYPEYLAELSKFLDKQNSSIQAKSQRLVNYYTLYKAVGGQL